jgi:hypothetical protein
MHLVHIYHILRSYKMTTYKLIRSEISGDIHTVFRIEDNACIPFNPDNTDYQEYLEWVAEGNTPQPAEQS